MLHTSTSMQPAPLAMRLHHKAVCVRQAMLVARSCTAYCPYCPSLGYHRPKALSHSL